MELVLRKPLATGKGVWEVWWGRMDKGAGGQVREVWRSRLMVFLPFHHLPWVRQCPYLKICYVLHSKEEVMKREGKGKK